LNLSLDIGYPDWDSGLIYLQVWDTNLSHVRTFKIVVLVDMMADNSFKILVDYGEFNEVMFVSMTCHQVVHCTAIVLHTFLQQTIYLYT
jgi:hypothetical protein